MAARECKYLGYSNDSLEAKSLRFVGEIDLPERRI